MTSWYEDTFRITGRLWRNPWVTGRFPSQCGALKFSLMLDWTSFSTNNGFVLWCGLLWFVVAVQFYSHPGRLKPSAVITRPNIVRYYINNYRNRGRISIRCCMHKRHPIPHHNGWAMGVFYEYLWENWPRYNGTALYFTPTMVIVCLPLVLQEQTWYWYMYHMNSHDIKWYYNHNKTKEGTTVYNNWDVWYVYISHW